MRQLIGLSFALLFATSALATPQELKNDGFTSGGSAGFQQGFVTGEMAASVLTPPVGVFALQKVQLLFGPTATQQAVILHVWVDAGTLAPGAELYSGNYTLQGSSNGIAEIDLAALNIIVDKPFRVGIEFLHTGSPSVARDDDGTIDASSNYIFEQTFGWLPSQFLGLTGDWVIRAVIDDFGSPVDGGPIDGGAGPFDAGILDDAGVVDAGALDAGVVDAGELDAGVVDAGELDAGVVDAGEFDAGEFDAGEFDAGDVPVDAGTEEDAGPAPDDAGASPEPEPEPEIDCSLNSDCNNGSYCGDDGICTQDCRISTDCDDGFSCDTLGRCIEDVEIETPNGCGCDGTGGGGQTLLTLCALIALANIRRRRRRG